MTRYVGWLDGTAGAYGVSFPDCPGCTAMGATSDEAVENATAALREWMGDRVAAGLDVVRARSADEVLADPDLAVEMQDGLLVSVPLLLDAGRSVRANVSLDAALLQQIDQAARRRGLTRSAFLASAARDKIAASG